MIVRPMEDKDRSAVFGLLDQLIEESNRVEGNPTEPHVLERKEALASFLKNGGAVLVAEEKGAVIGAVTLFDFSLVRRGENRIWIEDLIVDRASRNKGVGKALMDAVKAFAKGRGIKVLKLNTQNENVRAHKFYEREGGVWRERLYRFELD